MAVAKASIPPTASTVMMTECRSLWSVVHPSFAVEHGNLIKLVKIVVSVK
jgi:hypothetical protein